MCVARAAFVAGRFVVARGAARKGEGRRCVAARVAVGNRWSRKRRVAARHTWANGLSLCGVGADAARPRARRCHLDADALVRRQRRRAATARARTPKKQGDARRGISSFT